MVQKLSRARFWGPVAPALVLPFVAALCYFVWLADAAWARGFYVGIKVFLLLWPFVVWRLFWRRSWPKVNWRHPRHRRALVGGGLFGLAVSGVAGLLMYTPLHGWLASGADAIRGKASALGILEHYWLFAFFLSLIHSLLEEFFWRWFVYRALRERFSPVPATFLGSAGFAVHHMVILTQFFGPALGIGLGVLVGIGGALWCMMVERQRTLTGVWLAHMLIDFAVLAIGHSLIT